MEEAAIAQTVLVVEDDKATSAFIKEALVSAGYHVSQSVDGAAIQVAHNLHPDVILLDMAMPHMNGPEVSKRLHVDPATENIPIIGMSAAENLARLPATVIDDRLPKPFGLDQLYAAVERWAPTP